MATQGVGLPKPPGFVPSPPEDRQATLWKQAVSLCGPQQGQMEVSPPGYVGFLFGQKVAGNHFKKKRCSGTVIKPLWVSHFTAAGENARCKPTKLPAGLVASVVSNSLRPHGLQPPRPLCPWGAPGKNTGVGCHALLQGSSQPRDQTHDFYVS